MGRTSDAWEVGGALTIDGASTLTGNVNAAGTVSVTGNITGAAGVNGLTSAVGTGGASYRSNYSWFLVDGANAPAVDQLRAYDWSTSAYRKCYLYGGSWVVV